MRLYIISDQETCADLQFARTLVQRRWPDQRSLPWEDWQEIDGEEQMVAEGAVCIDDACTCHQTWTYWETETN